MEIWAEGINKQVQPYDGTSYNVSEQMFPPIIGYRLKSVGALKMKFVSPMPEQINTPTMQFSEVSRDPC